MHYVRACEAYYLCKFKDPDTVESEEERDEENEEFLVEEEATASTSHPIIKYQNIYTIHAYYKFFHIAKITTPNLNDNSLVSKTLGLNF